MEIPQPTRGKAHVAYTTRTNGGLHASQLLWVRWSAARPGCRKIQLVPFDLFGRAKKNMSTCCGMHWSWRRKTQVKHAECENWPLPILFDPFLNSTSKILPQKMVCFDGFHWFLLKFSLQFAQQVFHTKPLFEMHENETKKQARFLATNRWAFKAGVEVWNKMIASITTSLTSQDTIQHFTTFLKKQSLFGKVLKLQRAILEMKSVQPAWPLEEQPIGGLRHKRSSRDRQTILHMHTERLKIWYITARNSPHFTFHFFLN